MDKEFYDYLYNLRASGFSYPTKENTRQLLHLARQQDSDTLQKLTFAGGVIRGNELDGETGNLSDEAIIHCRNMLIAVAVTMNMIASDHHVDHETSNALCDFYISKAERIRNTADFEELTRSLFDQFNELFTRKTWQSYGRLLDQCIDFIHQRLYSRLAVQDVAEYIGYSPTYLTTLFKQKTGITLYSFIQESKIQEARRILLCTKQPISEIASSLGYHSVSHFSKAFKAASGMSPHQYRNADPISLEIHV